MQGESLTTALIGLLLAAWIVGASIAIWNGLSMQRKARASLRQTARLSRLLETSPAFPAIVRADGKLEASDRFFRLLGLDRPIPTIAELVGEFAVGDAAEDWQGLAELIREAQRTGKTLSQKLSVAGSDKRFMARVVLADSQIYPNGASLVWLFDLTDTVRELERLEGDAMMARNAFQALAGLIEASPLPMWHRGPDYRLSFVNTAYVEAVDGQSGDDVVADEIELVEPVDGVNALSAAAKAQEAGKPVERLVSATIGGERRQIKVYDIPMGEVGVGGIAIDMQELINARTDARRQAEAQRNMLDKMSAAVAQFAADRSLTFWNLPFQRQFGMREEWLSESPEFARVLERMRESGKMPDVRDFPEWRAERENWFHIAAPVEENWLLPDGTHLRLVGQPTADNGLLLIFEDRTEQAQLASARDTLLRVRTATFNNLFEAVSVFSADTRLSIWNSRFEEIWGVEEDLLAQHPRFDELLPRLGPSLQKPSHVSILRELLQMTISTRQPRKSRIAFADGRIFQLSTVPLPDGNALLAMLDVTDSLQIEQALRDRNAALSEADTIKGKFLSNMSYEFRTPLTSIGGYAELLQQGIGGELPPQAKDYVDAISKSAERLGQQINAVLDFTQSEAGALPVARKPVDIAELVNKVEASAGEAADKAKASLVLDVKPNAGTIQGDVVRLKQAMDAIVDNALTHGGEGLRILIHASGDRNGVTLVVSDNGPGMDAQSQTMALDPVLRSQKAAAGQGMNGGLGLPLARKLVELHGGQFELESQPGAGTTVALRLPRTAPSA
ncbi:PAS-domain containing protein [Sphingorhabdus sp.]|uniref:sensor histidine kinase n=1 Tax=Sphingorhabdus sp. TaxID=1902408 RepID=UPI0032B70C31